MEKKELKKGLINSIIGALSGSFIVYLIIGPYNTTFVDFMQSVEKNGNAIEACLILFPALLMVFLIINIVVKIAEKK